MKQQLKFLFSTVLLLMFGMGVKAQTPTYQIHMKGYIHEIDAALVDSIVYCPNSFDPTLPIKGYYGFTQSKPKTLSVDEIKSIAKTPIQHEVLYIRPAEYESYAVFLTQSPTAAFCRLQMTVGVSNWLALHNFNEYTTVTYPDSIEIDGVTYFMWSTTYLANRSVDKYYDIHFPTITFTNASTGLHLIESVLPEAPKEGDDTSGNFGNTNSTGADLHITANEPYEVWINGESGMTKLMSSSHSDTYGDNYTCIPAGTKYYLYPTKQ